MHVDFSLLSTYAQQEREREASKPKKGKKGKGKDKDPTDGKAIAYDTEEIEEFLNRYRTAKIIIVLDTHSIDNGSFAWTGDSPDTYLGCTLNEVSVLRSHSSKFPHASADPRRMSPGCDISISQQIREVSSPFTQVHHSEPGLWGIHLQHPSKARVAERVGSCF